MRIIIGAVLGALVVAYTPGLATDIRSFTRDLAHSVISATEPTVEAISRDLSR